MDKETNLTNINAEDISFVEKEISLDKRPFPLREIAERLAFHKTAGQRLRDVLKYDPCCRYEVGDLIFKEYNESLMVSSKQTEPFEGAVVLTVVNKAFYKSFNCEMLEVDYTGGGLFRKYIDYMKKARAQVLLPANLEGKAQTPEKINKEDDPRFTELPLADKDLKAIEKNLRTALAKSSKFFSWNDNWQLSENHVPLAEETIKGLEAHFAETRLSGSTESLVTKFFGLEPSHSLFDLHCLSLNFTIEKKHKKDFLFVSGLNWGKWNLKTVVNSYLDNLPISAPAAELPALEGEEKPQLSAVSAFPLKVYLTWREILSGAVKIPKCLNKELSQAREYTFTDAGEGKHHTVIYYPNSCVFIGLKDFFAANAISQGTSLTLERKGPEHFHFLLKKSKKKLAVAKLAYDAGEDRFIDTKEEVFTFSLPNKIIYLEKETLDRLLPLTGQREGLDLRQLLILVFKYFGLAANDHALHFLRAYHLVDILKQTTQEEVELVLLNSPRFLMSEKKKGVFFYREPAPTPEAKREIPAAGPEELPGEIPFEEVALTEIAGDEFPELEFEEAAEPEAPPLPIVEAREVRERVRREAPAPAQKEKLPKKKKLKPEGEKALQPRRSEKRFIEERIELEESEQEALSAIKAKEVETEGHELHPGERKEDVKPSAQKAASFGGLFGEKLQSALKKKGGRKK